MDEEIFEKVQELRGSNARSQNRIREYEAPPELELKDYKLGKVEEKYTDPYKQAEYAYGMIEEEHNEWEGYIDTCQTTRRESNYKRREAKA